jgi:hypothetical protein
MITASRKRSCKTCFVEVNEGHCEKVRCARFPRGEGGVLCSIFVPRPSRSQPARNSHTAHARRKNSTQTSDDPIRHQPSTSRPIYQSFAHTFLATIFHSTAVYTFHGAVRIIVRRINGVYFTLYRIQYVYFSRYVGIPDTAVAKAMLQYSY